jgi:uncharacterized protein (DUF2267 family)
MSTTQRRTDDADILSRVEHECGLTREEAERAVSATLLTLGDRLSSGESRDLAAQLQPELGAILESDTPAHAFDAEEFVRRVAEREGVNPATAERHVRAVFAALARAVTPDEWADMISELPKDYRRRLLVGVEPAPAEERGGPPPMSLDDFLEHVSRRAALDREAARRATDAVLEALAERISGGEVDDIAEQLPPELRPALERGNERSKGAARPMGLKEFVLLIAELEGVTPEVAGEHARAVMSTLREAVSEKELRDMQSQLPDEYQVLFASPR